MIGSFSFPTLSHMVGYSIALQIDFGKVVIPLAYLQLFSGAPNQLQFFTFPYHLSLLLSELYQKD